MTEHTYWNKQPMNVNKKNTGIIKNEYKIDTQLSKLPSGFKWVNIDIDDEIQLDKLYLFLKNNYNNYDSDNQIEYSKDFIKWSLKVPFEYYPLTRNSKTSEYCISVCSDNGNICGFISGIPVTLFINGDILEIFQVNFLCVHSKLRNKRLTPVIIEEMFRRWRCINNNICIAMGPVSLPISQIINVKQYHRSLNIKNLIEKKFWSLDYKNIRKDKLYKIYDNIPKTSLYNKLQVLNERDIDSAYLCYTKYTKSFKFYNKFSKEVFKYYFLAKGVHTYIIYNNNIVTDIVSFISFKQTNKIVKKTVNIANLYYVFNNSNIVELMQNILVIAQELGYEVFNASDNGNKNQYLKKLRFECGSGKLGLYIYNYNPGIIDSNDILFTLH